MRHDRPNRFSSAYGWETRECKPTLARYSSIHRPKRKKASIKAPLDLSWSADPRPKKTKYIHLAR